MVTGPVPSVTTSMDAAAPVVLVWRRLETETDLTFTGAVVGGEVLGSADGADDDGEDGVEDIPGEGVPGPAVALPEGEGELSAEAEALPVADGLAEPDGPTGEVAAVPGTALVVATD